MTITFRLAECRDIFVLGVHTHAVIRDAKLHQPSPSHICRMVENAVYESNAFVVERDGVVVGSMCARWTEDWFGVSTVELGNLWMDKGLPARTVYRFGMWVMEQLRERGAEQFLLTEAAGSPHPALERLGFKAVATVRVGKVDAVLGQMKKRSK